VMREGRWFLEHVIDKREGYVRKEDGEELQVMWINGAESRFELLRNETGEVLVSNTEVIQKEKTKDIDRMLLHYGFKPRKPLVDVGKPDDWYKEYGKKKGKKPRPEPPAPPPPAPSPSAPATVSSTPTVLTTPEMLATLASSANRTVQAEAAGLSAQFEPDLEGGLGA